jgi:transaldolase
MKFFIDTANVDEIRELADTGIIDGVTTNPSLIARSGRKFADVIEEICSFIDGPVSAEVAATDAPTMIKEGHKLAKIAKNVTIKVPLTIDGLKTCKILSDEGTMVNVTLCFSAAQAILAAKAGASFISPFVGRLEDIGLDGMDLISDICEIYANYPKFETEVLVASVRSPKHVVDAARMGADVVTIPPSALRQLYNHPLTDKGLDSFLKDWAGTGQSIL